MLIFQNIIDAQYHYQPIWILIIIILSVVTIGYLYSGFNAQLKSVISSFFSFRVSNQSSREEQSLFHPASILLSLNFLLTASLFILYVATANKKLSLLINFSFLSFLIIIGIIFSTYLIKIAFHKLIGVIFDLRQQINEYVSAMLLSKQLLGICFLPIIVFISYGEKTVLNGIIYAGFTLLIVAYIFRVGKGTLGLLRRKITLFYLILYLCTLEVLPLLLGIKLIKIFA